VAQRGAIARWSIDKIPVLDVSELKICCGPKRRRQCVTIEVELTQVSQLCREVRKGSQHE